MDIQTVRDIIGEPEDWSNCITDEPEAMPYVNGAIIVDVFSTANEIAVHLRGETGFETLSVFQIENSTIREGLVKALKPGQSICEALGTPILTA